MKEDRSIMVTERKAIPLQLNVASRAEGNQYV